MYHAICHGVIKEDEGDIDAPIGRSQTDRKKMAVVKSGGKEAFTHFRVLKRFEEDKLTYIECRLKTGRTHQIRVHMAHIGHPLLGDEVYGPSRKSKFKTEILSVTYSLEWRKKTSTTKNPFIGSVASGVR